MKTKLLLIGLLFGLASLALAQGNPATSCSFTFGSGTGKNATQFCVSSNGNIVQFSRPAGVEYIANGNPGEGYGLCDFSSTVEYRDYADDGASGWGPAALLSSNSSSVAIARTTNDGNFTLTQTIKNVKATAKGPGAATVSMALRNNTRNSRVVYIERYANVDIGGDPTVNHFDYTLDTAYGLNPSNYGLASTNNTFTFGWDAGVLSDGHGPLPC